LAGGGHGEGTEEEKHVDLSNTGYVEVVGLGYILDGRDEAGRGRRCVQDRKGTLRH